MKSHRGCRMKAAICVLSCLAVALSANAACATTKINFANPQSFTDAKLYGDYGTRSWQLAVDMIATFMKRLGDRYVDGRQVLTIEVLDIDLAGLIDPLRSYSVRILSPATWPRIKVRYRLAQGGHTLRQGEETILDLEYLSNAVGRSSGDPLRYEKAMLEIGRASCRDRV